MRLNGMGNGHYIQRDWVEHRWNQSRRERKRQGRRKRGREKERGGGGERESLTAYAIDAIMLRFCDAKFGHEKT